MAIDPDEYERLSKEEKEVYVQSLLQGVPVTSENEGWVTTGPPKSFGQAAAGLFGLPIEKKERVIKHPFVITSFIGVMVFFYILSEKQGLENFVYQWGFIPSQFYRSFFLTAITSFFLHAGLMHLVGNIYYFYIFGDDVEDDMSQGAFIRLLLFGHLSGLILHMILAGSGDIPLVGASAGISALMGYYMVRFPRRQITYMLFFFYVWLHIPAFAAFLWKFTWEALFASINIGRQGGVAHWAHLGGGIWGALMALMRRDKAPPHEDKNFTY